MNPDVQLAAGGEQPPLPRTARAHRASVIAALLLASTTVAAQTTYRWVDPATGGTVISDRMPPADARQVIEYSKNSGAETPSLPYAVRLAAEKFPVVLFISAGCSACKQARTLLESRGVPFTEKLVKSEEELAELNRQMGGEALLPTISVGRQSSRGFAPAAWNELLDAAGYPATAPYRVKTPTPVAE